MPLADRIRPQTLDEVVGQKHILGPGKVLRKAIESGNIPNLIFYGPPGVGKTTVASIIAKQAKKKLCRLNGTTASTADIRGVVEQRDTIDGIRGIVLYLDEIQYLNKKQQQTLLEFIEDGSVTLIASTTENPYFYVYNAILSRSTVFEFKPVDPAEIQQAVERAFIKAADYYGVSPQVEDGVAEYISQACGGDVRKSLNAVELLTAAAQDGVISLSAAKEIAQKSAVRYDRGGDEHYDLVSALQKSIRGSDENAALHYLGRLLEAGDLLSPCRRLLVIASEDIGLAYPMAAVIVKSCVDSALQLGLPEARIPLAQAVVLLATAPKSNSAYMAIDTAIADIHGGHVGRIPRCLQNKHYDGAEVEQKGQFYKYPHDYPNHYVKQQYLPDDLQGKIYYTFGDNKTEQAARAYRERLLNDNMP
ncbi:MAG: replication-associated recombination protein A [Oscillospiraceae bacterium]|nr:replication-associated recombination protein A [Oscillospiraceae bacterium]